MPIKDQPLVRSAADWDWYEQFLSQNHISDRILDNLVRGLVGAFFLQSESLSDLVIRMDTFRGYLPV